MRGLPSLAKLLLKCPFGVPRQVSTALGLLLSFILLRGLPHQDVEAHYASYMCVLVAMGLTVSWCAAACIGPVFSEIVPEHLRRCERHAFPDPSVFPPCAPPFTWEIIPILMHTSFDARAPYMQELI